MEGSPAQQPSNQPVYQGKPIPDPNTDFGDETFDDSAMSRKRISTGNINDWIFSMFCPKRKVSGKALPSIRVQLDQPRAYQSEPNSPIFVQNNPRSFSIPSGYEIQNGLLIQKKSLAELVRDQIRFPVLKSSRSIINGGAIVLFAVGVCILYSELPTRPELVLGIIIVAISANIIISNR